MIEMVERKLTGNVKFMKEGMLKEIDRKKLYEYIGKKIEKIENQENKVEIQNILFSLYIINAIILRDKTIEIFFYADSFWRKMYDAKISKNNDAYRILCGAFEKTFNKK